MTWAEDDELEIAARRRAGATSDTTERRPAPSEGSASGPAGAGTAAGAPDIGWVLYSRWEPLDPAGIVVEILHRQAVDEDTGETWPETTYYLYAHWHGTNQWRYLPAADVDPSQGGPDRLAASTAIRMLLKPLVMRRRYVQLSAGDIETVRQAAALARTVAQ